MKFFYKLCSSVLCIILILITMRIINVDRNIRNTKNILKICCVICGAERTEEALTMIKSSLIFESRNHEIEFLIFTEPSLFQVLNEKLDAMRRKKTFTFKLFEINFPVDNDSQIWRELFKPCAAQRLFIPSLLENEIFVLYVDTDVIFLDSPEHIFEEHKKFADGQHSGLAQESESKSLGWYPRFALHPFYGELGLNSGVMLMDLKAIRKTRWTEDIKHIFRNYSKKIVFGDQDLINIYFHYHPDEVKVLPCEYNYRADHCMHYNDFCDAKNGVEILHGNRGAFHEKSEDDPIFKQIYGMFSKFEIDNLQINRKILIDTLKDIEAKKNEFNCNRLSDKILFKLKRSFLDHQEQPLHDHHAELNKNK